jgi:hypothetical protein
MSTGHVVTTWHRDAATSLGGIRIASIGGGGFTTAAWRHARLGSRLGDPQLGQEGVTPWKGSRRTILSGAT